ncbi:MAG: hypothetical protein RL497_140 [Pseudomonadota bacterium]|jgi:TetR/AcrR family transcriptional repressor of nem operon
MSWKPEHKSATRDTILKSAAELFLQQGYETVGIDQVMGHAGMTRGAFYAHFKSKRDLYAEAVLTAGRALMARSEEIGIDFVGFVRVYLATEPAGSTQITCPLACLVTDIAQRDEQLKVVYERLFNGFVKHLRRLNTGLDEARAQACASSLIGAQAVARAVNSPAVARQLLVSAQQAIIAQYFVSEGEGSYSD